MKQYSAIQELLDRYWEGETTLEEERRLKALFQSGNFPDEFQCEAQFFQGLQAEQAGQFPGSKTVRLSHRRLGWYGLVAAGLLLLLSAGLWFWMPRPVPVAAPPLVQTQPVQTPVAPSTRAEEPPPAKLAQTPAPQPRKRQLKTVAPKAEIIPEEDTCEDPEQALAEIKAALALVSSKINRSKQQVEKGLQEVDKVEILLKNKNG